MNGFLLGIVMMVAVSVGAFYVLKGMEISSQQAYSSVDVRN